jgi:hypothetical protein
MSVISSPHYFSMTILTFTVPSCLIRKRLILPYLTVSFHPSVMEEYTDGLLMALQKKMMVFAPSFVGRSGVATLPVSL